MCGWGGGDDVTHTPFFHTERERVVQCDERETQPVTERQRHLLQTQRHRDLCSVQRETCMQRERETERDTQQVQDQVTLRPVRARRERQYSGPTDRNTDTHMHTHTHAHTHAHMHTHAHQQDGVTGGHCEREGNDSPLHTKRQRGEGRGREAARGGGERGRERGKVSGDGGHVTGYGAVTSQGGE
eukprot:3440368-Rhodomonas_salina.2